MFVDNVVLLSVTEDDYKVRVFSYNNKFQRNMEVKYQLINVIPLRKNHIHNKVCIHSKPIKQVCFFKYLLTNSKAYETRRYNAAFTRAL